MAERLPTSMRAAVLSGPKSFRTEEVPLPQPGPGQVLVRVEGCGLCGSNLPLWEGRPWFNYPREPGAPGHEGWGRVAQVGARARGVRVGDRVAFLSGRAFAEYDAVENKELVRIPPVLDGLDVPAEPMACAINVALRSQFQPRQAVAVVGVGFLGALLVRLAQRAGARVFAISRRDSALEVAQSMGAHHLISLSRDEEDLIAEIEDETGGAGCDVVVEAVGLERPLSLASQLVRTRGRLVIAGFHQDGLRQIDLQHWNWRGIDVVNAHERDPGRYVDGMRTALHLAGSGEIDLRRLITHRFPLSRLGQAFDALGRRPAGFLKGVVTT